LAPSGRRIVIEEGLTGQELSLLRCGDGRGLPLATAQDFKRVGEVWWAQNGNGMGGVLSRSRQRARSRRPPVVETSGVENRCWPQYGRRGIDTRGCCTPEGCARRTAPKVVETTCAFGDPGPGRSPRLVGEDVAGLLARRPGRRGGAQRRQLQQRRIASPSAGGRGVPVRTRAAVDTPTEA